ncbi:hypothetical protein AAE02nite_22540 [Adhaeribacter aerolatus]|uniref:Uncharacterized protein n=1 Tax=Adhaeribacter aerolatus TaxID=670289 RepID=A0A512AY25_9BACT|nr:hypothetical protein [Adhaeribacter aerolatus]GEO04590.1 hypothetical protein AAE02nite_22540 [Adhaeribacter aerolatus]
MENTTKDYSHIKGWGIDADPANDPTYPMKPHRSDAEQTGYSWDRPTQQPVDIEVLKSIERPNVSAVFGISSPPTGLSGMIRRFAFKYSESSYGHWLPLILADRVNIVEGVLDDLMHGHVPNIFAEKGMKAEWKHNPKGLVQKIAITALIVTAAVVYVKSREDSSEDDD